MKRIGIIALALALLASCQSIFERKFDKTFWNKQIDWDYPNRKYMLNDLLENHQIKGLSQKQLFDSIGKPDNQDSVAVYYYIVTDYGLNIDPVYTKNLVIYLNKDSVATGFKVEERKH